MQKNIFVILGMPRSGTSVMARGLKALGIDFGQHFITAKWNPKGSLEDADITYKINRRVLPIFENGAGESHKIAQFQNRAVQLLKERMQATDYWGFKDLRTTHLLPFWQGVFTTLHLNDYYIIAARNPLASAYSYQKVSGKSIEVGLISWLMHMILAIDGTHGKKRILVSYDQILAHPSSELERIKQMLQIPNLSSAAEIDSFAKDFLDKQFQHYDHNTDDLKTHPIAAALPLCLAMHDLFIQLAKDDISFNSDAFQLKWIEIKKEYQKMLPLYQYINSLLKKNKALERDIKTIQKSLPWKIIYPLRIIDDALRSYRRKAKEKNMIEAPE